MSNLNHVNSREIQPMRAVVSLALGNIFNLMKPTRQFDWSLDIALPLSRIPRFVGQTAFCLAWPPVAVIGVAAVVIWLLGSRTRTPNRTE